MADVASVADPDHTLTHASQADPARAASVPADVAHLPVVSPDEYELLGEVSRGGLGRILRARHRRLDRVVAIKELLRGGKDAAARFLKEAAIGARLQHPSIVPVYEAGCWPTGEPFYAMKLITGRSLKEVIAGAHTLDERLALLPNVLAVAEAVAYAHSEHVIHRDLKPSNVLVGAFGETVVVDWGLARDIRSPDEAGSAVVGTPAYMAPEQAEGRAVDERADIYALGAILHHVLSGAAPYQGASSDDIVSKVVSGPPAALSALEPGVPVELSTIVAKSMARRPEDRYATAKDLADDLKRFQSGQLVSAHRYGVREIARRWLRRNRAPVLVAAFALAALTLGGVMSIRRIVRERNVASARSDEMILVQARTSLAQDPTAAIAWLKTYPPTARDWRSASNIATEAWSLGIARHVLRGHESVAEEVVFSPDDRFLYSRGYDEVIRMWEVSSGRLVRTFPHSSETWSMALSKDGRRLAIGTASGLAVVWETSSGKSTSLDLGQEVRGLAFSPDSRTLALAGGEGSVHLWLPGDGTHRELSGHQDRVNAVAFAPGGDVLASAGGDGDIRIWELSTGGARVIEGHRGEINSLAFSPDGRFLASGGQDRLLGWLPVQAPRLQLLDGHGDAIHRVAFSPDGQRVATASLDRTVRVWKVSESVKTDHVLQHEGHVTETAFSSDGSTIASVGWDRVVRLFDVAGGERRILRGHGAPVYGVAFSHDGRHLASGGADGAVRIWSVDSTGARILTGHTESICGEVFSPDGTTLYTSGHDATVRQWELATGSSRILRGHTAPVCGLGLSSDGRILATASYDRSVRVWDPESGEGRVLGKHQGPVNVLAMSSDGKTIATGTFTGELWVWHAPFGTPTRLDGHTSSIQSVAFSRTARLLASAGDDGFVRLWDLESGHGRQVCHHPGGAFVVKFSPDDTLLASAGWADRTVRLSSTRTGDSRILGDHQRHLWALTFSPDGATVAAGGRDPVIQVWNLTGGESRMLSGHQEGVMHLAFSSDGQKLVSGGRDKTVRVWDLASGTSIPLMGHGSFVTKSEFSPDGAWIASTGTDRTVRLWPTKQIKGPPLGVEPLRVWFEATTSAVIDEDQVPGTPSALPAN